MIPNYHFVCYFGGTIWRTFAIRLSQLSGSPSGISPPTSILNESSIENSVLEGCKNTASFQNEKPFVGGKPVRQEYGKQMQTIINEEP